MKQYLLFFALFYFISPSFCQYSDLKEYGLKGNVKSINDAVYLDLKPVGKKWKIDSTDNAAFHKNMYFNPSGQMDTLRVIDVDEKDSMLNSTIVFDFENDIKIGGKQYGYHHQPITLFDIEWMDNRTYKTALTDTSGQKIYESTSWLSIQFQDSVGQTLVYDKGKVVNNSTYVNRLDKSKRVIGIDYFDQFSKPTVSETIEYLEFDKRGNWTKCVVRDSFTGKFKKLTVRAIEYY